MHQEFETGPAQGVEDAMEQIFQRYAEGVGSYMLARVGSAELAEELTARVFVLVVQRHAQCRGNVAGWVWSIARSVLARHFRSRGRLRAPPPPSMDSVPDPGVSAEIREMRDRLPEALAELDDRQREIVYLKYFQDLSNREIAEATGITPSNVGVVLHRALKRLRELMEVPARERNAGTE
jgi:RNA polymerase sigma-70 factor (ECF subfamily)